MRANVHAKKSRRGNQFNKRRAIKFRSRLAEFLEERLMLANLMVTNPTDSPVANLLSLREAVAKANLDAAAGISDTIAFESNLGSKTISKTLFDRIGYAARQGGASASVSADPSQAPAISPLDVVTLH
jgi:hypothetical protein